MAFVILVINSLAAAQPPPMSAELRNAQALAQAQKWAEAVTAYETVLKTDKTDPRPHAGIAASLYGLAEYQRALTHALEAARLLEDPKTQFAYPGLPPGAVLLRIARIHNRLGKTDEAFSWLAKAANYPIPNVQALDT
jgi:tetratricopeptide (TPR) repeat protein